MATNAQRRRAAKQCKRAEHQTRIPFDDEVTPGNFAAKARRFMLDEIKRDKADRPDDIPVLHRLADMVRDAVHFVLPDGGALLDDGLRGLVGHEARLPFPLLTLEYRVPAPLDAIPDAMCAVIARLVIAKECTAREAAQLAFSAEPSFAKLGDAPGIFVTSYVRKDRVSAARSGREWMSSCVGTFVPRDWQCGVADESGKPAIHYYTLVVMPNKPHRMVNRFGSEVAACEFYRRVEMDISRVLEFCEALTCRNVRADTLVKGNSTLNARRERDGKLPLYETRVLTLDGEHLLAGIGSNGPRSQPRPHLRRGHIRRLPSGNVWVTSTIVNAHAKVALRASAGGNSLHHTTGAL